MDTDMARHVTAAKAEPADVAGIAIDAVAAGAQEIVVDDISRGRICDPRTVRPVIR
jgi:hypothetical protein